MLETPIGRLRAIGIAEGISFITLLGIAMPLKYMADMPLAVRLVGSLHGLFFVVFCLVLVETMSSLRWPVRKAAGIFAAAVLPFGPFVIDGWLRREAARSPTDGGNE